MIFAKVVNLPAVWIWRNFAKFQKLMAIFSVPETLRHKLREYLQRFLAQFFSLLPTRKDASLEH